MLSARLCAVIWAVAYFISLGFLLSIMNERQKDYQTYSSSDQLQTKIAEEFSAFGEEIKAVAKSVEEMRKDVEMLKDGVISVQNTIIELKETQRSEIDQTKNTKTFETVDEKTFDRGHKEKIGLLIISCNRPDVSRALDKVLKYRPKDNFPIILSQDCGHVQTAHIIDSYEHSLIHIQQPNLGPIEIPDGHRQFENYYKISRHFKWALSEVFNVLMFEQVVILEDDLEIAPDFFNYFEATLPLLKQDKSLYCVSAWNDNGKKQFIQDNEALFRSDFFPGLGWMITKEIWDELEPKWPAAFWDDWLRDSPQRRERACIRPEISRTYTFGEVGASQGQYFREHLQYIVLNDKPVDFLSKDLSYLIKENYDGVFEEDVYQRSTLVDSVSDVRSSGVYRIEYGSNQHFESISKSIGLMSDLRAGVPRCAYKGVVPFMYNNVRVYLAPKKPWRGYQPQ